MADPVTKCARLLATRRTDVSGLIPIVSPTAVLGANSTGNGAVTWGFNFLFDGSVYTGGVAFAYGFLRLAGAVTSSTNSTLFAANTSAILAPWWDGMKTAESTGYVRYEVQGSAPWRRCVLEWRNYLSSGHSAAANDTVVFQVVIYETTNRFEYRYGTRVRTGTPSSNTASVGFKGDTSSVSSNRRDLAPGVVGFELGGSTTTTTKNLSFSTYDILATNIIVCEPAWPMSGRLFLLDERDLAGLQDPYGEPAWKLANAVNWLWCRHCPANMSFAPQEQTERPNVTYIQPVRWSVDTDITYELVLQVYASSAATLEVNLDVDDHATPQPTDGGHWTPAAYHSGGVSAGWNEIIVGAIATNPSKDLVRLRASVSSGNMLLGHALLKPQPQQSFDIKDTYASGWLPMGLGQIRQQGAPVHAEWFNRAWRNLALVLADRSQVVWSSAWPVHTILQLAATTAKPQRTLGVAPAALRTWPGQDTTVRLYARDSTGGATVWVGEAGGSTVEIDVPDDTYRLIEEPLRLLGEGPTITMSAQPAGNLCVMGAVVEWAPDLAQGDLFEGVTPAPRLEALFALALRIERALYGYAVAGLCGLFARGKYSTNRWRISVTVPPATRALRPRLARVAVDLDTTALESSLFGASSGSGSADEIVIPGPHSTGVDDFPPEGAVAIASGSNVWEPTPSQAMDRLMESPTAQLMTGAAVELVQVLRASGVTFVPLPADSAAL